MKEQEKAKEFVEKYLNYVSGWTTTNKPNEIPSAQYEVYEMKLGRAKQCALIAVDEIIKSAPTKPGSYITIYQDEREANDYWEQVKQEIENL